MATSGSPNPAAATAAVAAVAAAASTKSSSGSVEMVKMGQDVEKGKSMRRHSAMDGTSSEVPQILPMQGYLKRLYDMDTTQIAIAGLIGCNFIVAAASAQMAVEMDRDKIQGNETTQGVFKGMEWFFLVIFTVELCWNMYANFFWNFWTGPDFAWNMFDFLIVLVSWLAMALADLPNAKAFRTLRAFRVFRLFKRIESLRLIIEGVMAALPGVFNAFAVLLIFMGIWAVMGVEFFGDKPMGVMTMDEEVTYEMFGSFPKALFTMFQILTFEGWNEEVTKVLVYDMHYWGAGLFSILFVFIGGLVLMNVVVAILLEKYLMCMQKQAERKRRKRLLKDATGVSEKATGSESSFWKYQKNGNFLRHQAFVRRIYSSDRCQMLVAGLILLNFIITAVKYTLIPVEGSGTDDFFFVMEIFFTLIFTFEIGCNMWAYYPKEFWMGENSAWNIFDFVIVLISILALPMQNVPGVSVLRLFRAFRVMRLFKRIGSLRVIVESVLKCLPRVFQAFLVMMIVMGVWSILAVEYFREEARDEWGSFIKSMLTLWQVMTGDSWASGKHMARYWIFDEDQPAAACFFITYIFVASIIMNNVVITILLESYLKTQAEFDVAEEAERREKKEEELKETDKQQNIKHSEDYYNRGRNLDVIRNAFGTETARNYMPESDIVEIYNIIARTGTMRPVVEEMVEAMADGSTRSALLQLLQGDKPSE